MIQIRNMVTFHTKNLFLFIVKRKYIFAQCLLNIGLSLVYKCILGSVLWSVNNIIQ